MNKIWTKLVALWNALPPKTQQWIKGAEVAVVTAVVSAFLAAPASDFTTRKGIAEFAAGVAATAYAALRLYMAQSPIPVLVKKTTASETLTVGNVRQTASVSETTTSGGRDANGVPPIVGLGDGVIDSKGNFTSTSQGDSK